MVFHDIDYNTIDEKQKLTVFKDISEGNCSGYVIRNFFDSALLDKLRDIFYQYPHEYFVPYDGFESLPRPFNFIFKTEQSDWKREADYIYTQLEKKGISEVFQSRMKKLVGNTELFFSSPQQAHSFSKSWSSLRRLQPEKGYFEVHCGRLFQDANKTFYNFFRNVANVDMQMVFLMIVDRPEDTVSDIDIYSANWNEVNEKVDAEYLKDRNGNVLALKDMEVERIQLNEGDILFFDEGNCWHAVPRFSGNKARMSFGGFVTQYREKDKVQFWV
ncbi:MAG: hypothetical protein M9888_06125 [Chitinophagales bacterium]|nr:hypothetical protein [Chitinophagales bacterium]